MTTPDVKEMAERLRDCAGNTEGLLYSRRKMLTDAADLLDRLAQTPAQSDDVREALQLAINRIRYLGAICTDLRHAEANEQDFIPRIEAVLQPQPIGGKPIPLDKGKGGSEKMDRK